MITTVFSLVLLLTAVESWKQYDTCNTLFLDDYTCNKDNLCYYGCTRGSCWSQCNAVSKITWDGPEGTCNTEWHMNTNLEWCWLKGDPGCSKDTDCDWDYWELRHVTLRYVT